MTGKRAEVVILNFDCGVISGSEGKKNIISIILPPKASSMLLPIQIYEDMKSKLRDMSISNKGTCFKITRFDPLK